jgi:hypothetical protein
VKMTRYKNSRVLPRLLFAFVMSVVTVGLACCGGYNGTKNPPPPTSVDVSPPSVSLTAGTGTKDFDASVGNDYLNRGVTWSLSGAGCSGATCGMLTDATTSSVEYTAPPNVPDPPTVTLTATSINDAAKTGSATITITAAAAANTAAITLTITDTPPASVTLLSFEVSVTRAILNPGNVDLLAGKAPMRVEFRQLETESAFLSTASIPPGTYTSLALTFSGPELTFKNDTGAMLAGCGIGAACKFEPMGTLTSTAQFPGAGIVVMANSPTGIQLDVNPNSVLSESLGADFSLIGAVTVKQLAMNPNGEFEELDDQLGSVQGLNAMNKSFTLHTPRGDFVISLDTATEFEFESCASSNFSCLMNGQVIEVDAKLMGSGVLTAKKIAFEDDAVDNELEGTVFKIDDATHFEMVVVDALGSMGSAIVGSPTLVTLSNPSFQVKGEGLAVPNVQQGDFESAADTSQLFPGQTVEVRVAGSTAGQGPPLAVTASRVRLRMGQFTANVKTGSIAAPNFSVTALPMLFLNAGSSSVHVQTSSQTDFDGISGLGALASGNSVSLRGLLFKNGALSPELIAKKVRLR